LTGGARLTAANVGTSSTTAPCSMAGTGTFSCGHATDYGYREWSRSCLANAVAQGAYYAFLTGPTVSGTAVQVMVQKASSPSGVAVKRVPTVACYCPSGSPAALGSAVGSCTAACPDGTTPGTYLAMSATYTR
jgi:hypothetical protein